MRLTSKQIELMRVISGADGVDLDEIVDRVRYTTTKQSLQFSIRALIGHKLIEKRGLEMRRGRERQVIQATNLGKSMFMPPVISSSPSYVASVEDDEILETLE